MKFKVFDFRVLVIVLLILMAIWAGVMIFMMNASRDGEMTAEEVQPERYADSEEIGEVSLYVSTEGAKWAEQYLTPTTTIIFFGEDQREIGRLEWSTGKFVFVGEAEESALVFFEHFLKPYVDAYIECEARKLVAEGK